MTLRPLSPRQSLKRRVLSASNLKRLFRRGAPLALLLLTTCTVDQRASGIPSKAQETIDTMTQDFAAGRYQKIYNEAADEWRSRATLDESNETFRILKSRLGAVKERTFLSGKQQQNSSNGISSQSLVVRYNTKFKREDGTEPDALETFTLVERDGRYLLAGYSVNSDLLRQ